MRNIIIKKVESSVVYKYPIMDIFGFEHNAIFRVEKELNKTEFSPLEFKKFLIDNVSAVRIILERGHLSRCVNIVFSGVYKDLPIVNIRKLLGRSNPVEAEIIKYLAEVTKIKKEFRDKESIEIFIDKFLKI